MNLGELKDIDGNIYSCVQVGEYLWINSNLFVTKFNCGTKLNYAKSFDEWNYFIQNNQPAYCFYDFDEENKFLHGALYNKYVFDADHGEIAPDSWLVPNIHVVEQLIKSIGTKECGAYVKATDFWSNADHNNQSGLNILPSGYIDGYLDEFRNRGSVACLGMRGASHVFSFFDDHNFININDMNGFDGFLGVSLRCIKKLSIPQFKTFVIEDEESKLLNDINLELYNGIKSLKVKQNDLFDFIALILIVTPEEYRNSHINKITKIFANNPLNKFEIDIEKRISFIVENQLSNNTIFVRLASFNDDLTDIEAIFISLLIDHCVFPAMKNKYFDLTDSNNFLMVLTIVEKVKVHYQKGEFPSLIGYPEIGLKFIKNIVSKMS